MPVLILQQGSPTLLTSASYFWLAWVMFTVAQSAMVLMDRIVYLQESTGEKLEQFSEVASLIQSVIARLSAFRGDLFGVVTGLH